MERENPDQTGERDLFGNPVVAIRDRRGRPSFKKSPENQDFVSVRAAAGWTQECIAQNMGIDVKTLKKNFSQELKSGAIIVDGMMLDVLMKKVRDGHMPAVRQLRERLDRVVPQAPKNKPDEDPDAVVAESAPGKKEQKLLDAQNVPDDWGDIRGRRNH